MTTTEPHAAIKHRCPFCGAEPGQPCRTHRGAGRIALPHSRRIALTRAPKEPRKTAERVAALCCTCGHQRTVSADYSRPHDPDYSYSAQSNHPLGWRKTCTLKCEACGTPTRHAVLNPPDQWGDYDERVQRYVLGGKWDGKYPPNLDRLRAEYFAKFPRNPYLNHRYWTAEAIAAWQDGTKTVSTLCGDTITLHRDPAPNRTEQTELVAPTEVRADQEYEDEETGLWWMEMDCVDCLRVSNDARLKYQRSLLLADLLEVTNVVDSLGASEVTELRGHLGRIMAKV